MVSNHVVTLNGDRIDPALEDLGVSKHPETICHVEHGSFQEQLNGVLGEIVIKTRRHLVSVSNTVALKHPEDDESDNCNGEEHRNTHTIEHGYEYSIKNHRELKMHNVSVTLEESNILTNLGLHGVAQLFLLSLAPLLISSSQVPSE